jgi:hypothetical protein
MGLQIEAQDLVVRCYALWSRRTLELHGKPYDAKSPLHADALLEKPELPDQAEWTQALGKAGLCLGVTFANRFLSPENLGRFRAQVSEKVEDRAAACADLPQLLSRRSADVGLAAETDRLSTARQADQLCEGLRGTSGVEQVKLLPAIEPNSRAANGRHVADARKLVELLRDVVLFGVFDQLRSRRSELAGAEELLEHVPSALRQDEINVSLAERVRDLARQAQRLLHPDGRGKEVVFQRRVQAQGSAKGRAPLNELTALIDTELHKGG